MRLEHGHGITLLADDIGDMDAESRKRLRDYFDPLVGKYDGAPRNLAQRSKA